MAITAARASVGTPLQQGGAAPAGVRQPPPPVVAADFPIEALGAVPRAGDGRIPNPTTPTGTPASVAPRCDLVVRGGQANSGDRVDALVAGLENRLRAPEVICLAGRFDEPIRVWGKFDPEPLVLEAAPGHEAVVAPGPARPDDVSSGEFDGVAAAVSVVGSTAVEVRGLTVTNYWAKGTSETPAGILVEVRGPGYGGPPSACLTRGTHHCGGIYLLDDHVSDIANRADEAHDERRWCGNSSVDAFGIEVESYGRGQDAALQHVVLEGDSVTHTRTGQSETVAINGDVEDFLVADDTVADTDNIGLDIEGWYNGTTQASLGLVEHVTVADVDTWSNAAYGTWDAREGRCLPFSPNAAGIYDDGATHIWIADNVVAQTDQGISLDTETAGGSSSAILVTGNLVWDSAGTRRGDPSSGPNPPGVPGRSAVAGHAYDAFYVDAFGPRTSISDVYAADNVFANASRFFGGRRLHHNDVVTFGGRWSHVELWDNTIVGGGGADPWTTLLGVDTRPVTVRGSVIDCNEYEGLSPRAPAFSLGGLQAGILPSWQRRNGYGWDHHSTLDTRPDCPAARGLAEGR